MLEKFKSRKFIMNLFVSVLGLVAIFVDFDMAMWSELAGFAAILISNVVWTVTEGKIDREKVTSSVVTGFDIAELVKEIIADEKMNKEGTE